MPPLFNVRGQPCVITIHDLTHLHYYSIFHKIYFNNIIRPLLKNADSIITVSEFTAKELHEWSGLSKLKIHKIYNGVSNNFFNKSEPLGLTDPYILYVGNRRRYKNIEMLFKAYSESKIHENNYSLMISGEKDNEMSLYERKYGVKGYVKYLGYISDSDLPIIYKNASAVVFISKYEGFGLPILEAMASGTPVITSNLSAMPEVAGGAAILVNPFNVEEISNAIRWVLFNDDARNKLIENGIKRAEYFSWDKTANSYWELFSNIVKKQVDLQ